jgi:hypothetical protein
VNVILARAIGPFGSDRSIKVAARRDRADALRRDDRN